ncbi:MAG: phenylacetate--CoA ligase family protein [Bacteroidetes bacterium]|nr:MAG: phenylacetate--CoA ligase family protein [Bacteroidota bacterium]
MIPEIEKKSLSEIKEFQESKIPETLKYLKNNSKFYSELFAKNNIKISEIKTIDDLTKIPVTTKDDLQKYNSDFICVPKSKIIDYITTSGTLGEPVTFAMTDNDLERLAYNEQISFSCANGKTDDIYQLMVTMDRRFMAGLAYFSGIRKIGAGIVRVGPGNPELQFDTISRINPTAFVTVPSFITKLIEYAEKNNIDYKNASITKAVCIGEAIRNNDFSLNTLGKKIKDKWNIKLYSTYASTEMGTAFTECEQGHGGHHHPEMIIVEFLDDDNNPVADDQSGEVTITTIGVEGMPLLRFKTGDICYHHNEPCACGRNTTRLGPVIGRKKQMIKYKGTTLYPPALYDILNEIDCVENYIVEISTNNLGTDEILINIGCKSDKKKYEKIIKDHFRAKLRVAPQIRFLPIEIIYKMQFPEMSRKPVTFIDNRKKL